MAAGVVQFFVLDRDADVASFLTIDNQGAQELKSRMLDEASSKVLLYSKMISTFCEGGDDAVWAGSHRRPTGGD